MYIIGFGSLLGQVYKVSIGAACNLSWPSDRLVIQVLDDSTDPTIKVLRSSFFFHIFQFNFELLM